MQHENLDPDNAARLQRLNTIRELLSDVTYADQARLAVDLVSLAVALLAEEYPAKLSSRDKKLIRENYPGATDSLMSERSLSTEGLALVAALLAQTGKIVLDYSPESHCKADLAMDDTPEGGQALANLSSKLGVAFQQATKAGASVFGVATTMILVGALTAVQQGAAWPKVLRPLLEAIDFVMKAAQRPTEKEVEEQALKALMAQMGISRAEAKKYWAMAKENGGAH